MVFDAAQDAYVLEASGISKVDWNPVRHRREEHLVRDPDARAHPGARRLARRRAGGRGERQLRDDGALALRRRRVSRDAGGRRSRSCGTGFEDLQWLDLAVEADDTILAVGFKYDVATGVYRVDPMTGASSALNNSFAWQKPTGVAVGAQGEIYVADAGVCTDGACTGGRIVRVDPQTGAATPLSSGGLIAGRARPGGAAGAGRVVDVAGRTRRTRSARAPATLAPGSMRRALRWGIAASLLLAGGLALYLLLVYAIGRPADPAAARELHDALFVYGRLLLVKGLLPQLWLALWLGSWLERRLAASARGPARLAALLAASAGVAGLLVASTLLRAELPGSPRVVFADAANFARTWLEMSAAVTAALVLPRLAWPALR